MKDRVWKLSYVIGGQRYETFDFYEHRRDALAVVQSLRANGAEDFKAFATSRREEVENRRFPGIKTDTRRAASEQSVDKAWGWQTKGIESEAKRHGFTPQSGYVYRPEIADERGAGDPLAWCHPHEVKRHKQKVCAKRNQSLVDENGKVLVRRVTKEPGRVRLAESMVNDQLALLAAKEPEVRKAVKSPKELVRLRREIVERHGQKA